MARGRSELSEGHIIRLDFGVPSGSEAGFARPAVIVTAQSVMDEHPTVIQVVPLTSNVRSFWAEVTLEPDGAGVTRLSNAQCQHVRSISAGRVAEVLGHVGAVDLRRIREVLSLLLDAAV